MQRIDSPQTGDAAIEQEIQRKGKTALRVTPADIQANIVREYYFTAADGVDGRDLREAREADPSEEVSFRRLCDDPGVASTALAPLTVLTFCVLVLKNGFTVTGESACASPENFDAEIGRRIARDNAVSKVWPLMGYELKSQLAWASRVSASDT